MKNNLKQKNPAKRQGLEQKNETTTKN